MKNFFSTAIGKVISVIVGVVLLMLAIYGLMYYSIKSNGIDQENFVTQLVQDCQVVYDNSIKAIIELAQVDRDTKDYLISLVESTTNRPAELDEAYNQMVATGNAQPFMFLMSQLGNTNFNVTAEKLQDEIIVARSRMTYCSQTINLGQKDLRDILGLDVMGRYSSPLRGFVAKRTGLPTQLTNTRLTDVDGDYKITVLDWRPPLAQNVLDQFEKPGSANEPINIYQGGE